MKLSDGIAWVLVPRVATEEMQDAAVKVSHYAQPDRHYTAMLAAAPQPPVEELVEVVAELIFKGVNNDDHEETIARAIVKRLMGEE